MAAATLPGYGVITTLARAARTKGGDRPSSTGQDIQYFRDTIVLAAAMDGAGSTGFDQVEFGPMPRGAKIIASTFRIIGDATVALGTDIDIGWRYLDGSSEDIDAFEAGTVDGSAATIDVAGLLPSADNSAEWAPTTNDRPWNIVLACINDTNAAAGTLTVEWFWRNFR